MKIAYFNYLYDLYGASIGSTIKGIKLMEAIGQCGHEVKIYWRQETPGSGANATYRTNVREKLKKYLARYLHEANQLFKNFRYLREEQRILKAEKPDLLITRLDAYVFSSMWLAKKMNIPVILEADSPVTYELRTFHKEYLTVPRLLETIENYNLRQADAAVVVSNVLADYFARRRVRQDDYIVIPNGADTARFHPNISAAEVRQRFHLNNNIVIGFIGSFHYWHGVENLIALFKPVLEQYERAKFLLVGEGGPLKPKLESYINTHQLSGRVCLTGHVPHDEVPKHIAAMDIVLAPYPDLPFFYYSPVKVYEYMACGKPVVASELGQITEAIEHGVSGFLVKPGDIAGYLQHLFRLMESPKLRQKLGQKAAETAAANFAWAARGKQWAELCERVLEQHRQAKKTAPGTIEPSPASA
ncbi:MAG: glycosyltransferase family 1 protein [Calditrichaeota bacterium]|nr:MAG: glycosyltransferase family 1 protein [Calditrichota bacterium]